MTHLETTQQTELLTIDRQYSIQDPELYLKHDPTLEEAAAIINGSIKLVVGPDIEEISPFEQMNQVHLMEGRQVWPYGRIVIGDSDIESKKDLLYKNEHDNSELRFVEALQLLAEYDLIFAKQLLPYLAREVFIKRTITPDDHMVQMKSRSEVVSAIERLKLFAAQVDDEGTNWYGILADASVLELQQYDEELKQVLATSAATNLETYKKRKKKGRIARVVGGAACIGLGIYSLVGFQSLREDTGLTYGEASFVTYDLIDQINQLEGLVAKTDQDKEAIQVVTEMTIDEKELHIDDLLAEVPKNKHQEIKATLIRFIDDVREAISDGDLTTNEWLKLRQKAGDISKRFNGELTNDTFAQAVLILAAATPLILGVSSVVRGVFYNGGPMDPLVKRYNSGDILPNDLTSSPAMNDYIRRRNTYIFTLLKDTE